MFEKISNFFKALSKKEQAETLSKDTAKERLHLVLMQDRANVSADFLELMKQEIIEVIKKYIDIDEKAIDVRLTNKQNGDGTNGIPALYANIPIVNVRNEMKKEIIEKEEISKIDNQSTEFVENNAQEEIIENEVETVNIENSENEITENNEFQENESTENEEYVENENQIEQNNELKSDNQQNNLKTYHNNYNNHYNKHYKHKKHHRR